MKIEDFEIELKSINKDLSIRPNNVPKKVLDFYPEVNNLASILYCGVQICSIPNYEIFDEKNGSYGVDLRQDGKFVAHRTRPEALAIVKDRLQQLENKEYADQFFGRGEYSDAALIRKDEPVNEVVDVVEVEAKPVTDTMLEEAK